MKSNQSLGFDNAVEALSLHAAKFDYANTLLLTKAAVTDVFQKVNTLFPYNKKVIGAQPIEIMLIDAQHESRNGEATVHFGSQGMAGGICIYQLRDACTGTPEHFFLYELGHLAHMKATGTLTDVPAQFRTYLSQLGTACSRLSPQQQQEIFADTFMLTVISKYPELDVPISGISGKALEICYEYIHTFFDTKL